MKSIKFILLSIITAIIISGCVKDDVFVGPPIISNVSVNPSSPGATDEVTISATVKDLKDVTTVKLYYKVSADASFSSLTMTAGANSVYSGVIPSYPLSTVILYYIEAENVSNLKSYAPAGAPSTTSAYTVGAPAIVMNEIFSRGTASDPDWIELYNSSNESVNIGGYKIYDIGGQSGAKEKMTIPAGTTIAPKGFYVVVVDDAASANPPGSSFGLSSSGEEVWLESAAGYIIDNVSFPAMPVATTTYGRKPDGSSNWEILTTITRNAPNTATAADISNMTINPVAPTPADAVTVSATVTDTQGLTSVKLYYKVGAGTYSSMNMTAAGNVYSATIPAQIDGSVVSYYIEAINTATVAAYEPATAPGTAATYTVASPSAISNFAISPTFPTSLQTAKVTATIIDAQGLATVKLYYKVGEASYTSINMTVAGNDYSADIPAQAAGSIVSYYIEAINNASVVAYAPVTAPATVSTYTVAGPIVMNEIQSRGVAGDPDWIEVYNTSASSIDIGGYKIYDSGGQSGSKPKMEFAPGTIIPANGFVVIVVDDANTDYPDGSSFGLSSSGETVWLENASGTIIDQILFGATANATESYGRQPDGTSWKVLTTITKGASNGTKK